MKKIKIIIVTLIVAITVVSCGVYNFTGTGDLNAKTYQVNFFQNNAPIIEPGLDRDFTLALQDLILNQTSLDLVRANGDLVYEGEIVEYRVSPMSATSNNTAAQNRLTIGVQVRFTHTNRPEDDFDQRFSFFFDYPASTQLINVQDAAYLEIFERITQDIFNASLAKW
ncbi:LptE family protein [Kordia sp. YSTF-M3]|uniref:LptE family protein n=1 Tax=Kordia aestuariivivens TaxID=2759037 RepID=A0ABR7QE55_9FLAO|nr:LptE family protein [Kordia aestuariivivens]MBC8756793.1 LptE family protein [Kordia aestuariivivens]